VLIASHTHRLAHDFTSDALSACLDVAWQLGVVHGLRLTFSYKMVTKRRDTGSRIRRVLTVTITMICMAISVPQTLCPRALTLRGSSGRFMVQGKDSFPF